MIIHSGISDYSIRKPVVSVGMFDGVHKGHLSIIRRLKEVAEGIGGESVLFTFWPHPRIILNSGHLNLFLINTIEEKKELLMNTQIDHLVIFPFTKELSEFSAEDFIKKMLVQQIGLAYFISGFNHRFGHNKEGSFENLMKLGLKYGFNTEKADALTIGDVKVSSTQIRKYLQSGEVQKAKDFLGYDYFLYGTVIKGNQLGRTIGFPTANMYIKEKFKLLPSTGVYAVKTVIEQKIFRGVLNIGYKPTVSQSGDNLHTEVHLFDFSGNLYNREIKIFFIQKLREEKKFDSLLLLKKQLERDKDEALKILQLHS